MDTMATDYDVIVVGAGLFGSAAAKYISTGKQNLRVALIGPSEPKNKNDATIHGAHYDEGRIYRSTDKDDIWGTAAGRSVERYKEIENKTGLKIHEEVGFMYIAPRGGSLISRVKANAESAGRKYMFLQNTEEIKREFPYMDFGGGVQGVFFTENCGYLNPRRFVTAQKRIAEMAGCRYIDDVVDTVQRSTSGNYVISLAKNQTVTSRKVLLATGGFTHCRDLLPAGLKPDMSQRPQAVILVEVDDAERYTLKDMPCIVYKGGRWDYPDLNMVAYIMPPIKYPDGKYYLKVGHGHNGPRPLETPEEITRWYHNGSEPEITQLLIDITRTVFPSIKMDRYKFDYCVTTSTPKGYPYVDLITPDLGVAIGGCGQGAKSSDEFGKMAASMMTKGGWDHDFPEGAFKFKTLRRNKGIATSSKL